MRQRVVPVPFPLASGVPETAKPVIFRIGGDQNLKKDG